MNIGKLAKFFCLVCFPGLLVTGPSFAPANHGNIKSQNLTQQSTIIPPQEAAAIAVNNFEWSADGIRVNNPQHRAAFTVEGVAFAPVKGGPEWQWQLSSIGTSSTCLIEIDGNALAAASYPVTIDDKFLFERLNGSNFLLKTDLNQLERFFLTNVHEIVIFLRLIGSHTGSLNNGPEIMSQSNSRTMENDCSSAAAEWTSNYHRSATDPKKVIYIYYFSGVNVNFPLTKCSDMFDTCQNVLNTCFGGVNLFCGTTASSEPKILKKTATSEAVFFYLP